jgi:hypothetical protein
VILLVNKNIFFNPPTFFPLDLEKSGKRFKLVTGYLEDQPDLCLAYLNELDCEEKVQIPIWNSTSIKSPPKTKKVNSPFLIDVKIPGLYLRINNV